jgi:hypothetical protein
VDFTPVPRRYACTAFRSSLEADWACTLDNLGIEWRYEPVTVTLPSGEWYVPDFWLPELATYIEVKGAGIPRRHKPAQLAELETGTIVLLGLAARPRTGATGWRELGINWEPADGGSLGLVECKHCQAWQWARLAPVVTCRRCGARFNFCHLAGPGEITFRRSDRSEWTVAR